MSSVNTRAALTAGALIVCAAFAACSTKPAPPVPPSSFDSSAQAGAALFEALRKDDQPALAAMFGPDSADLLSSGDPAQDHDGRERFIDNYQQMHRIGLDAENRTTLFVGAENWPFPIPLVDAGGKWRFDTDAGKQEVLYRRVGRNENGAIETCRELVAAEKEYFAKSHEGEPAHQYAQHFVSTAGHHDGLFWQAAGGAEESPIGPLLAFASSEATSKEAHEGRTPFRGYLFRLLKSGAGTSYIVNGKMTGGFAFVAYPAEYRSSGVMTFLVGPDGVVYQKDLGANTQSDAAAINAYAIDSSWTRAE